MRDLFLFIFILNSKLLKYEKTTKKDKQSIKKLYKSIKTIKIYYSIFVFNSF